MIASPRRKLIVWLDTALLIILILLFSPRLTGLALHEVLGIIFSIAIIIHLLVAWKWIRSATGKFFKTASRRTRINFVLNTVLFILMITELVSGFVISEEVLPELGIRTYFDAQWKSAHTLPLNFVLLFSGLHIAINWGWIVAAFKKYRTLPRQIKPNFSSKIFIQIGIIVLAVAIVSFALYGILGKPTLHRVFAEVEEERYEPTVLHGSIQLIGESLLLAVVVYVGRKWLRMRL